MKKLAIISTHPIQYYAPVFQLLHARGRISIVVYYTLGNVEQTAEGFGRPIHWDLPLLEGYSFQFVENLSPRPGSHHFRGIVNKGLISAVESCQPDAILVFGWAYHSHLKLIRYFKGKVPLYFRGDSTILDAHSGLRNFLRTVCLKWIYSQVDHVFYVGANNKAYFQKFGVQDHRLSFTPHAIDNERFAVERIIEVATLKEQLAVRDTDILILFAGKLERKKSPDVLLKAFLKLKDQNLHLLFVGSGVLEGPLRKTAANQSNVHFIDVQNQSKMPVFYQASDLLCLPSGGPGETWGLVVNEAMACGKAILVSNKVGCAKDLVRPAENGAVFRAGDVSDLANKLKELTSSGKRLAMMGRCSAEIIRDWTFLHIAKEIENKLRNETR